jgi:hypothetical protein
MNLLLIFALMFQTAVNGRSTAELAGALEAQRGVSIAAKAPVTVFTFELVRNGKVVDRWTVHNVVTTEGANSILNCYFKATSCPATWYVGLVDNAGFTAVAATDTAAKITTSANPPTTNGWQELSAYSESVRQTLTLGTVSAGSVDNSASKAVFTMNATNTVKGAFLSTSSTKSGGTAGVLYSPAAFSSTKAVENNDVLNVTATITQQ